MSSFNCPACAAGDHLFKASAIVEQGTATMKVQGVGLTADLSVGMVSGYSAVQQSVVAARLSPPRLVNPPTNVMLLLGLILAVISGGIFSFAWLESVHGEDVDFLPVAWGLTGVAVLLIVFGFFTWRSNRRFAETEKARYQKELNAWQHLWYCAKCGHTFQTT